jgi:hypothetical protein
MNYADHPLLEGFRDLPDDTLLTCAIAQLDMAAWIKNGAQTSKRGLAEGVAAAIEEGFKGASRESLEKFLYHAILAAIKANKEAKAQDKSNNPEA